MFQKEKKTNCLRYITIYNDKEVGYCSCSHLFYCSRPICIRPFNDAFATCDGRASFGIHLQCAYLTTARNACFECWISWWKLNKRVEDWYSIIYSFIRETKLTLYETTLIDKHTIVILISLTRACARLWAGIYPGFLSSGLLGCWLNPGGGCHQISIPAHHSIHF